MTKQTQSNQTGLVLTGNEQLNSWIGYPYIGDLPDDYPCPGTAPIQPLPSNITWSTVTIANKDTPPKRKDYELARLGSILGKELTIIGIVSRETLEPVARFAIPAKMAYEKNLSWSYDVRVYHDGMQIAFHEGFCLLVKKHGLTVVYYHEGGKPDKIEYYNKNTTIGGLV